MHRYISSSQWYELLLPDGWTGKEEKDCTSFLNSSYGVGAIQISAFPFPVESKAKGDTILRDYLIDRSVDINETIVEYTENKGISIAKYHYISNNIFWYIWVLSKINILLFVTYNCNLKDKNAELDFPRKSGHQVKLVLPSVRIQPGFYTRDSNDGVYGYKTFQYNQISLI